MKAVLFMTLHVERRNSTSSFSLTKQRNKKNPKTLYPIYYGKISKQMEPITVTLEKKCGKLKKKSSYKSQVFTLHNKAKENGPH